MVVGGGIAGIQSSLDLANSGFHVYLVESSPTIGGLMARLDKTFPTNDLCNVYSVSQISGMRSSSQHRHFILFRS